MAVNIALLRGINVGGNKMIAMSDLRGLLVKLGFIDPRTLLQSGNVVFNGATQSSIDLEGLLQSEIQKRFKLAADIFVRTATEWKSVIAQNPFRAEARADPSHLIVMFLKAPAGEKDVKNLQASITGPEIIRAKGRHAYVVYPAGIGTSRLTNTVIEAKLGTRGTARNWNTVLKLGAIAEEYPQKS